jgi:flagellar biosynthesis protein FlhF
MKEALLQIRSDLGEDALILKTKKLPRKLFALGEQHNVEVTAAIDENILKRTANFPPLNVKSDMESGIKTNFKNNLNSDMKSEKKSYIKSDVRTNTRPTGVYNRSKVITDPGKYSAKTHEKQPPFSTKNNRKETKHIVGVDRLQLAELKEELHDMKKLLAQILATGESTAAGGFAGPWAILYKRLIDAEINRIIAEDLINKLKNTIETPENGINKKFISVLSDYFPVSGPLSTKMDGPLVCAFVGPTGSGKTTTIAKLASYFSLYKENEVSIITADTYRIAAIEQIRSFAEVIEIGLQVVFSPDEIKDALSVCENDDIVFIDTAGRSQKNSEHMDELSQFLDELKPDEIHLVLSATTKDSDLADIIKRYKNCNINKLLFTKLDETVKLGNVFNIVFKEGIDVSYLTAGQSVPDDIELAQPTRFVQRLMEGSSL